MAYYRGFAGLMFDTNGLRAIDDEGRARVRAESELGALLSAKVQLRDIQAGRRLWVLWTILLALSGFSITFTSTSDPGLAALLVIGAIIVAVLIISYAVRTRANAMRADAWLVEVEFRLAQLAARADVQDPSQP